MDPVSLRFLLRPQEIPEFLAVLVDPLHPEILVVLVVLSFLRYPHQSQENLGDLAVPLHQGILGDPSFPFAKNGYILVTLGYTCN